MTIKSLNLQRGVTLDEEARFRIPFRDENGVVELFASEEGFHKSKTVKVKIQKDLMPDPVTLVVRHRQFRSGRIVLPSGRPGVGVTVSVHRFAPDQYAFAVEHRVADAAGRIEIPFEREPLRLFYGGPGCALGSFDLAPIPSATSLEALTAEEPPFEIRCEPPSHLIVRLVTDDPELRGGAPLLLRHGDVVVPPRVLQRHLQSLGLPFTTDGQGRIGLIALEPGTYEVYHGKGTSHRNLLDRYDVAKLASVTLGANATREIEVTVDFRLDKTEPSLFFPDENR